MGSLNYDRNSLVYPEVDKEKLIAAMKTVVPKDGQDQFFKVYRIHQELKVQKSAQLNKLLSRLFSFNLVLFCTVRLDRPNLIQNHLNSDLSLLD